MAFACVLQLVVAGERTAALSFWVLRILAFIPPREKCLEETKGGCAVALNRERHSLEEAFFETVIVAAASSMCRGE